MLREEWKAKVVEKVDGGRSTQPAGHHMAPNRLLQVMGAPLWPYKYPPTVEKSRHTTFWRFHLQSSHS
jgi:hypothetical protein